jgi:hypothetical protein
MTRTILAAVFLAGFPMAAQAQTAPDPVRDCARAYITLDDFRAKAREMIAQTKSDNHWMGLGQYVPNFNTAISGQIDFSGRGYELERRFPKSFPPFDTTTGMHDGARTLSLVMQSTGGDTSALVSPGKLFSDQYPLFATVRACDISYGFKPVLDPAPSQADLAARLRRSMELEQQNNQKRHDDRIAALDDVECAVRFAMAAQLAPAGPVRDGMNRRVNAPAAKYIAAGGSEATLSQNVQRRFAEQAQQLQKGGFTAGDLIEDVGACEKRYGLPPSGLKAN